MIFDELQESISCIDLRIIIASVGELPSLQPGKKNTPPAFLQKGRILYSFLSAVSSNFSANVLN
jgi:hypothetical protein